jgi:hypothetical protein
MPFSGIGADVNLLALGKGVEYRQTSASAPTLASAEPYHFFVSIDERVPNAVTSATFSKPNGTVFALDRAEGALEFEQTFAGTSALNNAFPSSGTVPYRVRLATAEDGNREIALLLSTGSLPNAPRLSNYTQAQGIDASQAFTLSWTAFQNAKTNDAVLIEITSAFGEVYFSGLPGVPGSLDGKATSLTLRLDGDTGQYFHQDGLPLEPRSKKLASSIPWSGLRNVTFILRDNLGNSFLSPSRKFDFPVTRSRWRPASESARVCARVIAQNRGSDTATDRHASF